jgi:murein DD-endopeptidase MepM/ murein hydrolase activator NlpD
MKSLRFEWGIGAASAMMMGAGLFAVGCQERTPVNLAIAGPDPRLILAGFLSADQFEATLRESLVTSVKRNETLSGVLDRVGAPREDANLAVQAAAEVMDLRRVQPGDGVTAWLEKDPLGGVRLVGLSLRPDAERQVLVSRDYRGEWDSHELKASLQPGYSRVQGVIEQSIYAAALKLGAEDQQVVDYADILGYDVDFQRETYPGDRFEIFFESFDNERGETVRGGTVLYASLDGGALDKAFYRYTPSDDGVTDYFDETGQSAKKFLMRTPINGARLSSGFGNRRHPILGYTKLHKGTDFAAPTGTPIYAAGNGVIERIGPFSTFGNYVRIQHANGYETAYAHMSRFAKGLRKGSRVRQGEVIGYVGTTGRSTGPHLHYEVHVNGGAVNAMSLKLPRGRKLEGSQLQAFLSEKSRIDALREAETEALLASAEPARKELPEYGPMKVSATAPVDIAADTPLSVEN